MCVPKNQCGSCPLVFLIFYRMRIQLLEMWRNFAVYLLRVPFTSKMHLTLTSPIWSLSLSSLFPRGLVLLSSPSLSIHHLLCVRESEPLLISWLIMNGAAQCLLLPQWGAAVLGKMKRMQVFVRRPLTGRCQTSIFSLRCNVFYS